MLGTSRGGCGGRQAKRSGSDDDERLPVSEEERAGQYVALGQQERKERKNAETNQVR
jgi:hypothetical protein